MLVEDGRPAGGDPAKPARTLVRLLLAQADAHRELSGSPAHDDAPTVA